MIALKAEASKTYAVKVCGDILSDCGANIAMLFKPARVALVTDDAVNSLYMDRIQRSLTGAGFAPIKLLIRGDDDAKNINTLSNILEFLSSYNFTKTELVICVGGGSLIDIVGIASTMFDQGMYLVQIPTTLVAAVNCCAHSCAYMNLSGRRNAVSLVTEPSLILCDTDIIRMLPERMLKNGAAEIIRYGVLADRQIIDIMSADGWLDSVDWLIERCLAIKSDYMERSAYDSNYTQMLKMGDAVCEAVMKCSPVPVSSSDALAVGLVTAARAAHEMINFTEDCVPALETALKNVGLPVSTNVPAKRIESCITDGIAADGLEKVYDRYVSIAMPIMMGKCAVKRVRLKMIGDYLAAGGIGKR